MSRTTFGSCASSAESITLLSAEGENGPDNATTTNLNLEFVAGETKSKNTEWIEEWITQYVNQESQCPPAQKQKEPDLRKSVSVLDFEIDLLHSPSTDLQAVLSEIFSLKVRYQIQTVSEKSAECQNEDKIDKGDQNIASETVQEQTSFFIVKVPPTNGEDRQLAGLAHVDQREILFYSKVIPDIRNLCVKNSVKMNIGVVDCFHAHFDRPLEKLPVEGIIENLSKAESVIVLDDLRQKGFRKRNFIDALTLTEVKVATRELAKIHAYSWVNQQLSGQSLETLWPFYYNPEDAVLLYEALLEDGFPILLKHLKEVAGVNKDYEVETLVETLTQVQKRGIRPLLTKLFSPTQARFTTLVHMDFWSDNLFFKTMEHDDDDTNNDANRNPTNIVGSNPNSNNPEHDLGPDLELDEPNSNSDSGVRLACRILDWQMFSIGRPTNDLALLLFTSLPSKVRKEKLDALLRFYMNTFQSVISKFPQNLTLPFDLATLRGEFEESSVLALLQVIASVDLALADHDTEERLIDALGELQKSLIA